MHDPIHLIVTLHPADDRSLTVAEAQQLVEELLGEELETDPTASGGPDVADVAVTADAPLSLLQQLIRATGGQLQPNVDTDPGANPSREYWRVGNSLGRTIYRHGFDTCPDGLFIGVMDGEDLARQVVEAVNAQTGTGGTAYDVFRYAARRLKQADTADWDRATIVEWLRDTADWWEMNGVTLPDAPADDRRVTPAPRVAVVHGSRYPVEPAPGTRYTDGGVPGTLVVCHHCHGDTVCPTGGENCREQCHAPRANGVCCHQCHGHGTLHQPDTKPPVPDDGTLTTLTVPDTPKMIRETLCVAATRVGNSPLADQARVKNATEIAAECDRNAAAAEHEPLDDRLTAEIWRAVARHVRDDIRQSDTEADT